VRRYKCQKGIARVFFRKNGGTLNCFALAQQFRVLMGLYAKYRPIKTLNYKIMASAQQCERQIFVCLGGKLF